MKTSELFQPIFEDRLDEKTFNVGKDVDYIYKHYFKPHIDAIKKTERVPKFDIQTFNSMDLPSALAQKASRINPVTIKATDSSYSLYNPDEQQIIVSLTPSAFSLISSYGLEGAHNWVKEYIPNKYEGWKNEINGNKIRGTIYHELAHWLDDTLHSSHLKKTLAKARQAGVDVSNKRKLEILHQKHPEVGMTSYEINSQIHEIKDLKRRIPKEKWDRMTFEQLAGLSGALTAISDNVKQSGDKAYGYWKRQLLQRMARERLLGASMSRR